MKFWLIVFFLTPDGEFISKKESVYESKAACHVVRDKVKVKRGTYVARPICVSNDHYTGRRKDPGVDYD